MRVVSKINAGQGTDLQINLVENLANQAVERQLLLTLGALIIEKTMFYSLFPEQGEVDNREQPPQLTQPDLRTLQHCDQRHENDSN